MSLRLQNNSELLILFKWIWWILCVLVTQSCLSLYHPMDCSPPESSVLGILQARILEWISILFSRGSSWPRDQTKVSCIAGRFFTVWAMHLSLPHRISYNLYFSTIERSHQESPNHRVHFPGYFFTGLLCIVWIYLHHILVCT